MQSYFEYEPYYVKKFKHLIRGFSSNCDSRPCLDYEEKEDRIFWEKIEEGQNMTEDDSS